MVIDFNDATCLTITISGGLDTFTFVCPDELANHAMTSKLGPNVLDLSELNFTNLIKTQKGKVKSFCWIKVEWLGLGMLTFTIFYFWQSCIPTG